MGRVLSSERRLFQSWSEWQQIERVRNPIQAMQHMHRMTHRVAHPKLETKSFEAKDPKYHVPMTAALGLVPKLPEKACQHTRVISDGASSRLVGDPVSWQSKVLPCPV